MVTRGHARKSLARSHSDAITADNWRENVLERLAQLDWERVVEDAQRFLMNQEELVEFKAETIKDLLVG